MTEALLLALISLNLLEVRKEKGTSNITRHTSHVTRHTSQVTHFHLEFNSATSEASAASIITVTLDTVLLHS
jgi:hypothetical protein